MSFEAGGIVYESPEACLGEVLRAIRVGSDLSRRQSDQAALMADTFAALRKQASKGALSELHRLRVLTLEAEYYQQRGDHPESVLILNDEWLKLEPKLMKWSKNNPLEPSKDRKLLRQKLWLLMHYVFYHHYRVSRQHELALDLLQKIENIINLELKTSRYHPAGTLAICNYFIGMCYRVGRGFARAERKLLRAQQETYDRAVRGLVKKGSSEIEKKDVLAYKDVLCARILYGLGWIASQQGQLIRAEQYLSAARNCLLDSRQEYLQLLIDSLLWIVIRRKTPYGAPEYFEALTHLIEQYDRSKKLHELMRKRCAFELIRGYLDLADFGTEDKGKIDEHLQNAQYWLSKIDPQQDPLTGQRHALHRARYFLIRNQLEYAEGEIKKAKLLAEQTAIQQRGALILESLLCIKRTEYFKALELLKNALDGIVSVNKDVPDNKRPLDPVLEAECCILLAHIHAVRTNAERAKYFRDRWEMLSKVVENYYLERLALRIVIQEEPFELEYGFPIRQRENDGIPTMQERLMALERYMITTLRERHPEYSEERMAVAHGLSRPQFGRRCKTLGIERGR